jgi:ADP-ribose pyrophosphatase YjhB (NUDIX family)
MWTDNLAHVVRWAADSARYAGRLLQIGAVHPYNVRLQERQTVHLRTDAFDVWTYRKDKDAVRYLLLHTSQGKADRWFNGGRFWQIPSDFTKEGETLQGAAQRCLAEIGVAAKSLWAVEHTYTIFNRRYQDIQLILVLAAEVEDSSNIRLSWAHSEYRWCTAQECEALLGFRGLLEGLHWTRKYVSEVTHPLPELRLSQ